MEPIRERLVAIALEWEKTFGIAPAITNALSEYDAAMLVGCGEVEYAKSLENRTAVSKGHDFEYQGKKFQVKANRPSGKKGSNPTLVMKRKKDQSWNYKWDYLLWVLYNKQYEMQEVWYFEAEEFRNLFDSKNRLSPDDMRLGHRLFPIDHSSYQPLSICMPVSLPK